MSVAVTGQPSVKGRPLAVGRPPRIADVTMFYGERSGGIRTYLEAKAAYAARTGRFEHHLVIPGKVIGSKGVGRHEHRSLRVAASNGYRVPLQELADLEQLLGSRATISWHDIGPR